MYKLYSNQVRQSSLLRSYDLDQVIYHVILYYENYDLQIKGYAASMEISSKGVILKFPELPNKYYSKSIEQSSVPLLSKNQILEMMEKKPSYDPEVTSVTFSFNVRAHVFVWKVEESRIGSRGMTFVTETHFDATSGVEVAKFFDRLNIIYD